MCQKSNDRKRQVGEMQTKAASTYGWGKLVLACIAGKKGSSKNEFDLSFISVISRT